MRRQLTLIALVLSVLLILLATGLIFALEDNEYGLKYSVPSNWEYVGAAPEISDNGILLYTSEGLPFSYERYALQNTSFDKDDAEEYFKQLGLSHVSSNPRFFNSKVYVEVYGEGVTADGLQFYEHSFFHTEGDYLYLFSLLDLDRNSKSYDESIEFLEQVSYIVDCSVAANPSNNNSVSGPTNESDPLSKGLIAAIIAAMMMGIASLFKKKEKPNNKTTSTRSVPQNIQTKTEKANNTNVSSVLNTPSKQETTKAPSYKTGEATKTNAFSSRLVEQETSIKDSYLTEGKLAAYKKLYMVCESWAKDSPNGALAAAQLASLFDGTALTHLEFKEIIEEIPTWAASSYKNPKGAEMLRTLVSKYLNAVTTHNENYLEKRRLFVDKAKTAGLPGTDEDLANLYDQWDSIISEKKQKGKDAAITLTKKHIDYWAKRDAAGYIYANTLTGLLIGEVITQNEQEDLLKYSRAQILSNALTNINVEEPSLTKAEDSYETKRKEFIEKALKSYSGTEEGFSKVYDQWQVIKHINDTVDKATAMEELRSSIVAWYKSDNNGVSYSSKLIDLCTGSILSEDERQKIIQYSINKQMEYIVSVAPEYLISNDPKHKENLEKAYGRFNQELIGDIFVDGVKQANIVVTSMAEIFSKDLKELDSDQYYRFLKAYVDVIIRKKVIHVSDDHVMASLMDLYPELIPNRDIASIVDAYATLNAINHNVSMLDAKAKSSVLYFADSLKLMEEATGMNIDAEKAFLDDPEYGLVPEKPIYTHGVVGSNDYLSVLRGPSGEPLMWERTHTTTSPGINGIIDVYQCKYRSGETYKVLFIDMYGTRNSTTIPQGFTRAK